jgi:hypothetical protein
MHSNSNTFYATPFMLSALMQVYVHRIEVVGPEDEPCLDAQLLKRNTDKETIAMAINADD